MDSENRKEEIELKPHEIASKTVTPTHTIDWYIKWVSSIILIVGMVLTANNLFPGNVLVQCLGIAQMHKSNAVPVRGKKQATEVANMRRG